MFQIFQDGSNLSKVLDLIFMRLRWICNLLVIVVHCSSDCDDNCKTCPNWDDSFCFSCDSDLKLQLSNHQCICIDGYYLQSRNSCKKCPDGCSTCDKQSGQTPNCTSCRTNMVLINGQCQCLSPYALIHSNHQVCDYPCTYKCNCGDDEICQSCGENRQSNPPCDLCDSGYFDDGKSLNCKACGPACLTCKTSANQCTSCLDGNSPPPSCSCPSGYFAQSGSCHQCSFPCQTCFINAYSCTSCVDQLRMSLDNNCSCKAGYQLYQNGCCPTTCLSCNTQGLCLTCILNRVLQDGNCLCRPGYVENGLDCENTSTQISETTSENTTSNNSTFLHNHINHNKSSNQSTNTTNLALAQSTLSNFTTNSSSSKAVSKSISSEQSSYYRVAGDYCDDGNKIDRDGCTNNTVDLRYQCYELNKTSKCFQCGNPLCQRCLTISKKEYCLTCLPKFIPKNSTCISQSNFLKQVDCEMGTLYNFTTQQCEPICGDSIVLYEYGEQCDYGKMNLWLGCSDKCKIRYVVPNCKPSISNRFCSYTLMFIGFKFLNDFDDQFYITISKPNYDFDSQELSFTSINLYDIRNISEDTNLDFCNYFQLLISGKNQDSYSYSVENADEQLWESFKAVCIIELLSTENTLSYKDQFTILLAKKVRGIIFVPAPAQNGQKVTFKYTNSQLVQGRVAQSTILRTNNILLIILVILVLIGGFHILWEVLDLYNWLVTFYFFNVVFPLNLENFFLYISWGQILFLQNPILLNQKSDSYYMPTIKKFESKGQDSMFLNGIWYDIYAILLFSFTFVLASIIVQIGKCFKNHKFQEEQIQKFQSTITMKVQYKRRTSIFSQIIQNQQKENLRKGQSEQENFQNDEQRNFTFFSQHSAKRSTKKDVTLSVLDVLSVKVKVKEQPIKLTSVAASQNSNTTASSKVNQSSSQKLDEAEYLNSPMNGNQKPQLIFQVNRQSRCSKLRYLILKKSASYCKKFGRVMLKIFYLTMLDFEISSVLFIMALREPENPIILINLTLCFIYQVGSFIYLYLTYFKVHQSSTLLNYNSYQYKYRSLYEEYNTEKKSIHRFAFLLAFKKKCFVVFLVGFFRLPLFQTVSCSMITAFNLFLLFYGNPFKSNANRMRQLLPETCIFLIMICMVIYAFNDEYQIYDLQWMFVVGWIVICLLMVALISELVWILIEGLKLGKKRYKQLKWLLSSN